MNQTQTDTRKKIIEAASYLFGIKGFEGTSTREIGRRAGVNIASLNYHFRSKQNLMEEVASYAWTEFEKKLTTLASDPAIQSTSDFVVRLYDMYLENGNTCLNQFKLFLDAKNIPGEFDQPLAFNELKGFLNKELNPNVPDREYIFFYNVIFSYVTHAAVLSMAHVGQMYIKNFLPEKEASTKIYLKQLVETLIKDLNSRY